VNGDGTLVGKDPSLVRNADSKESHDSDEEDEPKDNLNGHGSLHDITLSQAQDNV
jgi:hypothetical protein